jgi:SCY1-like protein 1
LLRALAPASSTLAALLRHLSHPPSSSRQLKNDADSLPPDFLQHKVLPALTHALSLSSSGAAAGAAAQTLGSATLQASRLLPLVLQLGATLGDGEWVATLQAPLLAAYKSADRGVRMALLEHLELYSGRLEPKRVVDGVWPHLISGFADTAPALREATLRAILPLAPKLSERILNNDLLRQLARTQIDAEPGIRTNTTILLGRLSHVLTLHTRRTVLVPAFARSLKDAFVHARLAGLMALMATGESYERDDMARLILPALAPCLVDAEKVVREQAKLGVAFFLRRIDEAVAGMPDSALPPSDEQQAPGALSSPSPASASARAPDGTAASSGSAASALAGWTLSAFARTLDGIPGTSGTLDGGLTRVTSPPAPGAAPALRTAAASASPLRASSAASASSSAGAPLAALDDDLIDIHADADDWSSFEVGTQKASQVPRRIVPRASAAAAAAAGASPRPLAARASSSRMGVVRTAEPAAAMARTSLAVKDVGEWQPPVAGQKMHARRCVCSPAPC